MDELYLLDKDLIKKYIIDMYSSILWVPRYNELGDCELVISATIENIKLLLILFAIYALFKFSLFYSKQCFLLSILRCKIRFLQILPHLTHSFSAFQT